MTARMDQAMAGAAAGMLPDRVTQDLRTRYRQLPVMLRTAGLAATYAYLVAKSDDTELGRAYQKVSDGIRRHLTERSRLMRPVGSNRELIVKLAELPAADYVRAAAEVELLAGWLRRLGEAEYRAGNPPKPPNQTNPQEA